jgi:hypothetical protein
MKKSENRGRNVKGKCPHCGGSIEFLPDNSGNTIIVNAESKRYAYVYPNGFCKIQNGFEIHKCEMTGKDGHVVK